MIWTKRQQLSALSPATSWYGILIVFISILLWLLAKTISVQVVTQIALLGMVWGVVLGLLGTQVVKCILFPLAFLFFAVPIGEVFIPALMELTASFTVNALKLTGFPVYWEGMLFSIPSGNFEVAKACSGIRYLFATVMLGSLFAYLNYNRYWKRLLFITISLVLPVIANGLRAYGIVLIAHYSNMEYATGIDHFIYGWIFFGIVIFILFYVGGVWRDTNTAQAGETYAVNDIPRSRSNIVLVAIPFLVMSGPIWQAVDKFSDNENQVSGILAAPHENGEWHFYDGKTAKWSPDFKGATQNIRTVYRNNKHAIQLYIADYSFEKQNAELINQINRFYDIKKWSQIGGKQISVTVGDDVSIELQQILIRSGEHKRMLWYWYDIDGYTTGSEYKVKLKQAWNRLSGSNHGGAAILLVCDFTDQQEMVTIGMNSFVRAMYPAIRRSLDTVRNVK